LRGSRIWTASRKNNDHILAKAADAALEFGQHLSATTLPCLRQPDPTFGSVARAMWFGFSTAIYDKQLIWTAVVVHPRYICHHLSP
jgi:hypothetical protein